ncbi:hypothetical protein F5876DRAFT_42802 [Lentinula aff. lateritia]|uniref:Uncharacterized protein n=1 Tax=Lentinula aff. lateritia TaxID=2804960 RepID=A0ACC1TZA1_9AGAR|nr:hypothetical protein F5876DRAFT_42802 [Lentinula aff. lateritia]
MASESSTPITPSALTPESTGSTGQLSSPDTSSVSSGPGASKKTRRQTAIYPHVNSTNKTQKPFSRSAAKRGSVMALGSIEHLQYYFTKAGLKSKKKPLDKLHHGLVPAIGSSIHSPGTSSITSISDLLLPPTPVIANSQPDSLLTPHVKSTEIDPETLLPGVVSDLTAVSRAWCIDLDASDIHDNPIDVLDVLQTTTRAIRSTRNYLLSQPDESTTGSSGTPTEHFRSNRLGPRESGQSSRGGDRSTSQHEPDPLTLIRRSALEVLAVLRELEEKTRLPLSDDAYDAQSDGGGSRAGAGGAAPSREEEEELATEAAVHEVDKDTSVAFSLVQVNGRYETVPVWEDLDPDSFSVDEDAAKEKKDRWDERLVLGSGWLYQQDITLSQLPNERKLVGEYLDLVDEVLFQGTKNARGEQRGWERARRRVRDKGRSRSRNSAKRRVSAGDVDSRTISRAGTGIGLAETKTGSGPGERRRVSTGMLPELLDRVNLTDEPQQMEGISEEAEETPIEDDALPEWAQRLAFIDSDLDRARSILLHLLPSHLHSALPTDPPSSSPTAHTAFLQSLSSGQLLCVAYNSGVRKSKKPWGYINKEGIHDILALQRAEAEKAEQTGESQKIGWTFRRSDNLRLWVGALKLRYMLPILVPTQALSIKPKASTGTAATTPNISNTPPTHTPLPSPLPLFQKTFATDEPPVMFDARIVAKQEEGWEEMLETVVRRWMWRVVDEKRMD